MKKVILCFGNEFLKEDSMAKELALKGIDIKKCDSVDDLLEYGKETELIIIDTVKDIKKVMLMEDLEQLKTKPITTMHDFDLGYFLKLLKAARQLPKVTIIGIPSKGDKKQIAAEAKKLLKKVIAS